MAFGSRNKGRAQEARPRPRCSRAKKELRLRRRVPWLDLLCPILLLSLGQILSLKRCSNQVELALPIDKKMIRSPNDSRDYRSSVSRTIPRRGFVIFQWAGYFRPIYFFRSKYPLASGINNDLSGAARAPPFSLRPSFLAFSIFMLSRVSRFLSFFFLSEEEIVQKNRGFLYQYPSMLRLFLFIVPLFFFSFFYEFVPRCTHSAG